MKIDKQHLKKFLLSEGVIVTFFWGLFLLEMAFSKRRPSLTMFDITLTLSYVVASCFINYFLISRFFYKGKYWQFVISLIATVTIVMLLEEMAFEAIFYPGSGRARLFNPIYDAIRVGIALIIFMGFKFGFDTWKKQKLINRLEREKTASQMDHLKSQISPHFLFNNLNNLYSKALEGAKETPQLIHQLANIMRYMLYESHDEFVPLSKELQHVSDYIALQKVQLEERGIVDFKVKGNQYDELKIAPFLLIGFIENCFKHSFSELSRDLLIKIHIDIEGESLHLMCSNPYSLDKESVNESLPKGIGLKNVKNRLSLIYPDKHKLKITNENHIFNVMLDLDLSHD